MKQAKRIFVLMLVLALLCSLAACNTPTRDDSADTGKTDETQGISQEQSPGEEEEEAEQSAYVNTGITLGTAAKGEYNKGIVLVKAEQGLDISALDGVDYVSAEPLYTGSRWYAIRLADEDKTEEAAEYLCQLGVFDAVDYDYVMAVEADVDTVEVTDNPRYEEQSTNYATHNIQDTWEYLTENGYAAGGSSDVVVAVIDTGVDYTHLDLRNNIWVNTGEIPGNGIDDDGNGYIDDIYGWNCVADNNDPMDDNGHGTHVAGIIAAENNEIGGVGIAYNCKIMVLKAGNSSGYFNNSDIAEAIEYAYMNGASVINMSFGGSYISMAVEDALQAAYNSCILVAAAGNDSYCNDLACISCTDKGVTYPAALSYVIGVMSTNTAGSRLSSFSNYDHNPRNSVEYEVCAVGESVLSCWPGNKYATLNGTSMAAPVVSAVAALLRSCWTDREVYSTKFIQSQIVNTGSQSVSAHTVVDAYAALTQLPTPSVNLYDYYIDDSTDISENNNGNGVMDAGETVRVYFSLFNYGGVASDVQVTLDTIRSSGATDPYFTISVSSLTLSDIGTYSERTSGEQYFEIVVAADCPNDYMADFNIRFTYTNGLDEEDTAQYSGKSTMTFNVSNGYHLSGIISEDTVFTADRRYIVSEDVVIPAGVTVTFKEGCYIQFYADQDYYTSPTIIVYGTLKIQGTAENMVTIAPSERYSNFACIIEYDSETASVQLDYVNTTNLLFDGSATSDSDTGAYIAHSWLCYGSSSVLYYQEGLTKSFGMFEVNEISESYIEVTSYNMNMRANVIEKCYMYIEKNALTCRVSDEFYGNVVMTSADDNGGGEANFFTTCCYNSAFMTRTEDMSDLITIGFGDQGTANNAFSEIYQKYASRLIDDYYNSDGTARVDVYGECSDISALWPYVVSVELFDKDGNAITTVGKEEITVRVTFNRDMDMEQGTYLTFGSVEPYADYRIDGSWVDSKTWEGTYTLKAQIENGQNYIRVWNACSADDSTKTVHGEYQLHEFTIDTTAAMSMNLQAVAQDDGILLTWAQDDYDTLLGYNIYRSEDKDGNFVRLNSAILLSTDESFLDENAEPGKTYWYTYTVVLSDFTESNPAGKVCVTAKDTMAPSVYHTPVNQGYESNNLVISCTASDNVGIQTVTLYYRTVGEESWKSLTMSKQNDKYSATIYGSDVTMAGLEYYIVATDGVNTVAKGSANAPYTVVVKSADSLLGMGDVDGDGSVTTKDALMLVQCLGGELILTDDQFKRADLNGDGVLSAAEALRILQYVNGKLTTLEM